MQVTGDVQTQTLDQDAELDALARAYDAATHPGIAFLNTLGGGVDAASRALPQSARRAMEKSVSSALERSYMAAQLSRRYAPDPPFWVSRSVGAGFGAIGGAGGWGTALIELPVTTSLLLRLIIARAEAHGFCATELSVRQDCLTVLSAAGPLSEDDASEISFLGARMAVTGQSLHQAIKFVAPKFVAALSPKLVAQAVPLLGAASGASLNYIYTKYYSDMADVHFRFRRVIGETGSDPEVIRQDLAKRLKARRLQQQDRTRTP